MYQTGTHGSVGGRLANQSSASYPIAYQQRRAGLSTVGEAHLLAVDWLGWICYFRSDVFL